MSAIVRTGIDLIEIRRIAGLSPEIRSRFLRRVFTPLELEICADKDERLSGRFACKEAVSKALGTGIGEVSWQEIEIGNDERNMPVLLLHGNAEKTAAALGISQWSVSISHTRDYATAIAVGTGTGPAPE